VPAARPVKGLPVVAANVIEAVQDLVDPGWRNLEDRAFVGVIGAAEKGRSVETAVSTLTSTPLGKLPSLGKSRKDVQCRQYSRQG